MVRFNLYLLEDDISFLQTLGGSVAEHIRASIEEYIQKRKNTDVSVSLSSWKGGKNGTKS